MIDDFFFFLFFFFSSHGLGGLQNGRASLGDALYRIITDVEFDPDDFLSTVDLTSEHKILDLKDRIEASVIIWNRKVHNKDGKSAWGSAVSQEKREQFEERAQTLLLIIKHRFPGIPQSTLDIAKIQENRVSLHAADYFIYFEKEMALSCVLN